MRIESSTIALSSQHAATQTHTRQETLVAGIVTGAWEAGGSGTDGMDVRDRERTLSPSGTATSRSLLEEYLGPLGAGAARQRTSTDGQGAVRPTVGDLRQALDARDPGQGTLSGWQAMQQALSSMELDGMDLLGRISSQTNSQINNLALGELGDSPLVDQVPPAADQLKMDLIRATVEAFTGRKLQLLHLDDLSLGSDVYADGPAVHQQTDTAEAPAEAETEPRFGLVYTVRDTHIERETTSFQAKGVVHTADGRDIDIDVSLTMDREFVQESSAEVRIGAALQDPLVINFEGPAAQLTQRTFAFDLDANGEAENIHFVGPGSGFLAWDRNGSGTVDDGSELFGPATGQGFSELAEQDEDGNGFIDEGDAIYNDLRIWEKDEAGTDRLVALQARGVGAIYLGAAATPFEVKDEEGMLHGKVRSSGIYLREDGGAGTVQQLDLVV